MEIRIAMNNNPGVEPGMPSGDTACGYVAPMTVKHMAHIGPAMPNRDAHIKMDEISRSFSALHTYVESWTIESNPDNGRDELVIRIKE